MEPVAGGPGKRLRKNPQDRQGSLSYQGTEKGGLENLPRVRVAGQSLQHHVEVSADGHETEKTWNELSAGEERKMESRLAESPKKYASVDLAVTRAKIVKRDRHFEKYENGVVRDTQTGLEWYAGPDKNTDWNEASRWVGSLTVDGGGWRMPTRTELKGLYEKGRGSRNMTPLLETTGWWVWSVEKKGSSAAWDYPFDGGRETWHFLDGSRYARVFAVRSR